MKLADLEKVNSIQQDLKSLDLIFKSYRFDNFILRLEERYNEHDRRDFQLLNSEIKVKLSTTLCESRDILKNKLKELGVEE